MARLPERLMVRGGTYYCRVWVPTDIAESFGRQLVVSSLRTQDLRTAKTRLARKTVELEDRFAALRAKADQRIVTEPLDQTDLATRLADIARQFRDDVADRSYAERVAFYRTASADPARFWKGELVALPSPSDFGHGEADAYTYFDHLVAEGDLDGVLAYLVRRGLRQRIAALATMKAAGNLVEHLTLAENHLPGAAPRHALRLARLLVDEEAATLQAILDGEPQSAPQAIAVAAHASPSQATPAAAQDPDQEPSRGATGISLDALFERWERETEPSASTLSSWRGIARDLKNHLGAKADDIGFVTPDDIVAWKDKLVAAGKAAATINNGYLACARALFRLAVANKLLSSDPAGGIKLSRKAKAGKKMLGYDRTEVARLLALASSSREPWKKWLPWLAAATGSRIGEMAQLHGSHIFESEGRMVVNIMPAADGGTIKNADSERTVPLHSALIAEGFLDFVRSRGSGPLFYGRTSGDPKRKHASKAVTNRLGAWIRASGFDDPRKAPNHALRHWFKSEASRLKIPDSVADAIQGHNDGRASSGYRHIGLDQMAEAIERIELPPRTNA